MYHAGPTTHISSLAALHVNYCIQMVDPRLLVKALDSSTDLRHDLGYTMKLDFGPLLGRKLSNCSDWFFGNLNELGIQEPLVVIIYSDGRWQMDEGHHRLAWALLNNVAEVPVIFDDSGADDESVMASVVRRNNVEVYHNTIADDLIDNGAESFASEVEDFLSAKTIPMQAIVDVPRRRKGGRHRA